jgi:hypothetical protein
MNDWMFGWMAYDEMDNNNNNNNNNNEKKEAEWHEEFE